MTENRIQRILIDFLIHTRKPFIRSYWLYYKHNDIKKQIIFFKNNEINSTITNRLEKGLGLGELARGVGWSIRPCCAVTGEGLEEALTGLHELILKRRKSSTHTGRAPSASKVKASKKVQRSHSHHY